MSARPSSALHAREHGAPVTVFGAVMTQYSSNIAVRRDWAKKFGVTENSPYKDKLKALKGITIGITSAGSGTDQLVRFLAKQAGLRPDRDMTITALGSGQAMLAAFSQNRIQAFSHSAPDAEEAAEEPRRHPAVQFLEGRSQAAGRVPVCRGDRA